MRVLLFLLLITASLTISKVYQIYHRDHLHDLYQDLPVGGRQVSVIAFYNSTSKCNSNLNNLDFNQNSLPGALYLLLGKYEMSTFRDRIWYEIEDHIDLANYLGINDYISNTGSASVDGNGNVISSDVQCPILVYLPIEYGNGVGNNYIQDPPRTGIKIWNSNEYPNWKDWLWSNLKVSFKIVTPYPFDFEVTVIPNNMNPYNKNKEAKIYNIRSIESHTIVEGYVNDIFYVNKNPRTTKQNEKNHFRQPTDVENPTYTIYPDLEKLILTEFNDGKFGFDIGMRQQINNDRFVKTRHSTTMMTHTRNLIIPPVLPNHDPVGFTKIKMPDGLHERLISYYQYHYPKRAVESWSDSGTQLNFMSVKSYMISLDHNWQERDRIANDVIRPILMKWSNETSLELTAFYGIREYETGAVLRNHVDRIDTHVYSAILQIGQTGIDDPWPLEVIGFDGKRYLITLKPGEMVLYEGAKLIHGRPYPLNGTLFSNAFVHFKSPNYNWRTSSIWKTDFAKDMFRNKLHITLQEIYS